MLYPRYCRWMSSKIPTYRLTIKMFQISILAGLYGRNGFKVLLKKFRSQRREYKKEKEGKCVRKEGERRQWRGREKEVK